jgi:nucleotide-binding universal stress UspA family protein
MDAQLTTTPLTLPVIDRVVVGFDRSPTADAALRFGAALARQLGAGIQAVQTWQYPATTVIPGGATRLADRASVDAQVTAEMERAVAELLQGDARVVDCLVERGPAAPALVRHAHGPAALVVLGSRGLSATDRVLLGSTTHDVLHGTVAPVLVVPAGQEPRDLRRIVVGVDGAPGSHEAVLLAGSIALQTGAQIVAVHATDLARHHQTDRAEHTAWVSERLEGPWTGDLAARGVDLRTVVTDAEPTGALVAIADDEDADLIVVGRARRSLAPPWHVGSATAFLTRHAGRPVLIASPAS